MSFYSLIKGITPKIRMLGFVLINSVILNVYVFGSWFRTQAVVLVSDFLLAVIVFRRQNSRHG